MKLTKEQANKILDKILDELPTSRYPETYKIDDNKQFSFYTESNKKFSVYLNPSLHHIRFTLVDSNFFGEKYYYIIPVVEKDVWFFFSKKEIDSHDEIYSKFICIFETIKTVVERKNIDRKINLLNKFVEPVDTKQ